jgi:hypothetical protein
VTFIVDASRASNVNFIAFGFGVGEGEAVATTGAYLPSRAFSLRAVGARPSSVPSFACQWGRSGGWG